MKRGFACLLFALAFLLTACEARAELEIKWYYLLPALIFLVIFSRVCLLRTTFLCPRCGAEFSPRWYQLFLTVHMGSRRLLRCPHCGGRHFCPRKRG